MNSGRVAIISYHTCPLSDEKDAEIGGMNTYILELSKALTKRGYTTDIYTREASKSGPKIISIMGSLRVIHLPADSITEFFQHLKIFWGKEKLSYSLISAHYYLSGLIGWELKKKYDIPLFVTFHTLGLMKNLVARSEGERETMGRIKSELLLIKEADKIIATSDSDQSYIRTLYNCPAEKISILTPGVNHKLFRPISKAAAKKFIKADPNHKLILYVGRIEPLKGLDVLLYAIKILIQKNPKIPLCLWIVGGNGASKELKRLEGVRKLLNIKTYVSFVGQKRAEELPFYYNASEVVLLPSSYESFGITALEAMACAVPVITTDVTGISLLLDKQHSSLLISAGNPIGLSKKIENLLTNKKEYERLRKAVFRKVSDLSWDQVAKNFGQIFDNLK